MKEFNPYCFDMSENIDVKFEKHKCRICNLIKCRYEYHESKWKKSDWLCKLCAKIDRSNWYLKNASAIIEKQNGRYIRNKDEILNKRAQHYRKSIETKNGWIKVWLQSVKARAKRKGLEFTLAVNDIVIPEYCPILGIKLERHLGTRKENSPSLDRLNSTKGYTKDNINIISFKANLIKLHGTAEEHLAIYKWMKKNGKF